MLASILAAVARRLEARKAGRSIQTVMRQAAEAARRYPVRSLTASLKGASLKGTSRVAVIAELKRASPSRGVLCPDFDVEELAERYLRGGAAALSVLTEEDYFLGSPEYLTRLRCVRAGTVLPLLRKDFIFESYQVYESRALGADALLLIAAILTPARLGELLAVAGRLGMEALVEVHTGEELEAAFRAGARLIGINNRDLITFRTDLGVTLQLAPRVPSGCFVVSESGIRCGADVARVTGAGAGAVLVGEALVTSGDPAGMIRELSGRGGSGAGGSEDSREREDLGW